MTINAEPEEKLHCSPFVRHWIPWMPLLFSLLLILSYVVFPTFYQMHIIPEDAIVENMTAYITFVAGLVFIGVFRKLLHRDKKIEAWIVFLMSIGCIFFAGEEISWGQRIFGWHTEDVCPLLAQYNYQNELNLHNTELLFSIRKLMDIFVIGWVVVIPLINKHIPFNSLKLKGIYSPLWLWPTGASCILITFPQKMSTYILELPLSLGEHKELIFAWLLLFYSISLHRRFKEHAEEYKGLNNQHSESDRQIRNNRFL